MEKQSKNMPELPEVQTTVNYLNNPALKILSAGFVDVWSDWYKINKKNIKNKKILKIWRRAKNVIFELSEGYSLLVHQKMTGHLLTGKWKEDPYNRFIHLILFLDDGNKIALSDARKFAKIDLWKTEDLKKELEKLGPEPLEKSFTLKRFKEVIKNKKGKVKQVLMDQSVISGIGNIYASEILWQAKVHPEKSVAKLNEKELELIYKAIKKILKLAVKLGGESFSDYRKPDGSKGDFDTERKAYKREGQKCYRCGTKIKRQKISQRSAFFCPTCQKL